MRGFLTSWTKMSTGQVWLIVTVSTPRGGLTDFADAEDFIGAASWAWRNKVYLSFGSGDADRFLDHIGHGAQDVRFVRTVRAPNGYICARTRMERLSGLFAEGLLSEDPAITAAGEEWDAGIASIAPDASDYEDLPDDDLPL